MTSTSTRTKPTLIGPRLRVRGVLCLGNDCLGMRPGKMFASREDSKVMAIVFSSLLFLRSHHGTSVQCAETPCQALSQMLLSRAYRVCRRGC